MCDHGSCRKAVVTYRLLTFARSVGEAAYAHVPQFTQRAGTGQGPGAATGGSFSLAVALAQCQHLLGGAAAASGRGGDAIASVVAAGLVDVLPSADAVGRAANTVGRVASFDSRFKVGVW